MSSSVKVTLKMSALRVPREAMRKKISELAEQSIRQIQSLIRVHISRKMGRCFRDERLRVRSRDG